MNGTALESLGNSPEPRKGILSSSSFFLPSYFQTHWVFNLLLSPLFSLHILHGPSWVRPLLPFFLVFPSLTVNTEIPLDPASSARWLPSYSKSRFNSTSKCHQRRRSCDLSLEPLGLGDARPIQSTTPQTVEEVPATIPIHPIHPRRISSCCMPNLGALVA